MKAIVVTDQSVGSAGMKLVERPEPRPSINDVVVQVYASTLSEIVQRVRDGRLQTNIGNVSSLDDAVATFNSTARRKGKTIIRVSP